jgi:hypothetical protein
MGNYLEQQRQYLLECVLWSLCKGKENMVQQITLLLFHHSRSLYSLVSHISHLLENNNEMQYAHLE